MNSLKTIVIKYVNSFIECNICNYMCSPKHYTQSNYNTKLINNSICNICINDIKNNNNKSNNL